jgi:hypothetical protein
MIKQRIKHFTAALLIAFTGSLAFVPVVAHADLKGDACSGINQLDGTNGSSCSKAGSNSLHNIIVAVIDILSIVVGFIAVIMLIVAGLRIITAGGDASGVASARSGIIYALVGLIIVAAAQVIVHFVLNKVKA